MAVGLNQVNLIGRLGVRVDISTLPSGGRVVNFSVATHDKHIAHDPDEVGGEAEWHRVVSFQEDVVTTLERHGARGRRVHVCGMLRTREWADSRGMPRFTTEVLVTPQGRVQFLDKPRPRLPATTGRPPDRRFPAPYLPSVPGRRRAAAALPFAGVTGPESQ